MSINEPSNPFLERIQRLSHKRLALLAAELERRLAARDENLPEPIAITGMACRMPGGADTLEELWQILADARDVIETVPAARWDAEAFYDPNPDTPGKAATKWSGFVRQLEQFDAAFFGISPREALWLDPQQRMLLEVAWEALEIAGERADSLDESETGVYIGISTNDYAFLSSGVDETALNAYSGPGLAHSTAAGRLSYFLGLKGPNLALDTACSSSGVAIHLACQALRAGECRRALAGGVNALLAPALTIMLSQAHMLAKDGRCKAFSRSADGFVRSEGCGILVLKRLSDAKADGDRILGLIRGSAVNHDGRSSGLAAPNGPSQEAVTKAALKNARLTPNDIDYIEAHGTGTVLGDAIELGALANVFGKNRQPEQRMVLGSVKTNIGHLESAAAVAGVIKVLLALDHELIPAHLHVAEGNENEALQGQPFEIPRTAIAWPRTNRPRVAGLSSFGFSGTNAHIVIEEPPLAAAGTPPQLAAELITASAKTRAALCALCSRHAQFLRQHPETSMSDFAYTANACRTQFQHRVAFLAQSAEHAAAQFEQMVEAGLESSPAYKFMAGYQAPTVAFLFTGQGSQYAGMGRAFYEQNSVFRSAIDQCEGVLAAKLEHRLSSVLFGNAKIPSKLIDKTAWTQPSLFAFEYAMAMMWQSWGVRPSVVLGHSLGEYVAACLAGVFSLEEALTLAYERGRLMGALPRNGTMLAVQASEEAVLRLVGQLPAEVSLAAVNGPQSIVLSGDTERLRELGRLLTTSGIKFAPLTVSHAFHSPMMDPILDEFERRAEQLKYAAPEIQFVSNLTGNALKPSDKIDAHYWRRHVRGTVRFAEGLAAVLDRKPAALIEIGPHPVLLGMAKLAHPDLEIPAVPTLRRGRDEWQCAFEALRQSYLLGIQIDWDTVYRDRTKQKLTLPTYPFQRQRYWLASPAQFAVKAGAKAAGEETARQIFDPALYEVQWMPGNREAEGKGSETCSVALLGEGTQLSSVREALSSAGIAVQSIDALDQSLLAGSKGSEGFSRLRDRIRAQIGAGGERQSHVLVLPDVSRAKDVSTETHLRATAVLALLQEVADASSGRKNSLQTEIWLVTCGASTRSGDSAPISKVEAAIARVASLEHPGLRIRHVDLAPQPTNKDLAQFAGLVRRGTAEHCVAIRNASIMVPRLIPLNNTVRRREIPVRISGNGAYLVTGSFSGIGLRTVQWLVERGAQHVYMAGRSEPSEAVREQIGKWEAAGANIHRRIVDVSNRKEIEKLFEEIKTASVELRGIVHSAGTLDDGVLMQQTPERFAKVFAPKVHGGWLLHEFSLRHSLDFFVAFGSVAAVIGSRGQANYAAANAFLENLAEMRQQQGLVATTIAWGAWSQIGMAARLKGPDRSALAGLSGIQPEKGMELLEQALASGAPAVTAFPVDWSRFLDPKREHHDWPLFELVSPRGQPAPDAIPGVRLTALLENESASRRLEVITDYVKMRILSVLMLEKDFPVPGDQPFSELGLDSLMALEVKNDLQNAVGAALPSTFLFDHPTLHEAASYLDALMVATRSGELTETDSSGYEEITL